MITCIGGGVGLNIDGEEVFWDGIADPNIHINLIKALYNYLSKSTYEHNTEISSVCLMGFDGGTNSVTIVFGPIGNEINYRHNLVHVFDARGCNKNKQIWETKSFNIHPYNIAVEVIKDIEKDFDKWTYFHFDKRECFNPDECTPETYSKALEERLKINIQDWLKEHYDKHEVKSINKEVKKRAKLTKYWIKKLKHVVKSFRLIEQ